MKYQKLVAVMVICIAVLALVAAGAGIFTSHGPGPFEFESIHGEVIPIYGRGIYQNMSADVAPQGIAQDYVTLFAGIPALLIALFLTLSGSQRARLFLAGVLGYFLVTYLFYMAMATYNEFYLVYIALTSLSFYSFLLVLFSFDREELAASFSKTVPNKFVGGFLIFNAVAIGMLWLGVVMPPGQVPADVQHYTTLIVQGMDLSLLLPASFICGWLFLKGRKLGYLLGPVYISFLSLLMTALMAKIVAMTVLSGELVPPIFIIPVFNITAIVSTILVLRNYRAVAEEE